MCGMIVSRSPTLHLIILFGLVLDMLSRLGLYVGFMIFVFM